jgi:hypothetical protein
LDDDKETKELVAVEEMLKGLFRAEAAELGISEVRFPRFD